MSPPVQMFKRQGLNTASAQNDSKQTGEQEEAPVAAASNYHTTRASPHHHIGAPRPTPPPTHVHRRQTEFHPCQIVPTRKDRCAHDNNPQWWARLKTVVATKSASPTPNSSAVTATLALEESISAAGQSNLFPGGGSIAKFLRLSAPGAGSAAVHVHPAVPLDSDRSDHVLCRLNADLEDIA